MSEKPSLMNSMLAHSNSIKGKTPKQRQMTLTNFASMVSEEKDQYIEKLRRRNKRARDKIDLLEDSNSDFMETIRTQQEVLEKMAKKLDTQKVEFRKELKALRARKNADILKLKEENAKLKEHQSENEVDIPSKEISMSGDVNSEAGELQELDSLRMDNNRLEEELDSLAKEMGDLKKSTNVEITEKYEHLLADKDEELRLVRQELEDAKGRIKDLLPDESEQTSAETTADEVLENTREKLKETVLEVNTLRKEQSRYLEEFNQLKDQLQNSELKKKLTESLLTDSQKKMEELAKKNKELVLEIESHEQREKETNELKKANLEIKRELDEAAKETDEKTRKAEEAAGQVELMRKKVIELELKAEDAKGQQKELVEKMSQEKGIIEASLENVQTELATVISNNELEQQRFRKEYQSLRQQYDWFIVSKFATLNALADELERLRKFQKL